MIPPHFTSAHLSQFLNQQNLTTPTNLTMSFVAAAARRFGRHAIAQTSLTAPHLTLAAQILGAAFAPPSSRIADFAESNDADLVSFNATAGLESLLKRPTTASDRVGTSSRTTKRVVISDSPESYDFMEIPSCRDCDHPHFEYYQDTRMNLDRILDENADYEDDVLEVQNYWLDRENFQMLSSKNQRILKMKKSELFLTLPELEDVDKFDRNCEADRAVWRERRANQQPIERIVNEEDDLALEFESDEGSDSVATDTTNYHLSNDAEPIGNEAEEISEAEPEQEVADVGQTEDALVTPRPKNARMLKELGCTLDGVYWSAYGRRIRRKPDRFSPAM